VIVHFNKLQTVRLGGVCCFRFQPIKRAARISLADKSAFGGRLKMQIADPFGKLTKPIVVQGQSPSVPDPRQIPDEYFGHEVFLP